MAWLKSRLILAFAVAGLASTVAHANPLVDLGNDPVVNSFGNVTISGSTVKYEFKLTQSEEIYGNFALNGKKSTTITGTAGIYTDLAGTMPAYLGSFAPITKGTSFSFDEVLGPGTYYLDFSKTSSSGPAAAFSGQLITVAPVPEPATWAMMVLGFMGVGFVAYRRKISGSNMRFA